MTTSFHYQPPVQPKTHSQLHAEACQRPEYRTPQPRINHKEREHYVLTGPYVKNTLLLWTMPTLIFRVYGRRGRYERASQHGGYLVWREYPRPKYDAARVSTEDRGVGDYGSEGVGDYQS